LSRALEAHFQMFEDHQPPPGAGKRREIILPCGAGGVLRAAATVHSQEIRCNTEDISNVG
jgi:hypothetical protein